MKSLDMNGPFLFTTEGIDDNVTETSLGNYALGYVDNKSTFIVQYVGRSDTDVAAEIKIYLSEDYKRFKYSYATSPKAAFEKECKNYHDFGGKEKLRNKIHPARPDDTNWECPNCDVFG